MGNSTLSVIAVAMAEFQAYLIANLGMKIGLGTIVAFAKMTHRILGSMEEEL